MKLLIALIMVVAINLVVAELKAGNQENNQQKAHLPSKGVAVDEVVVQSSLCIKPKQRSQLRRVRRSTLNNFNILKSLIEHVRVKRQIGPYANSQAVSNAAAYQNYNNFYGFGNSAGNAQAQAFNTQGPSGRFGASAAGSLTQALNANRYGVQNSAGASHALTFNLPNGKTVNFASTNSFANGHEGNNADSRASGVSLNRI